MKIQQTYDPHTKKHDLQAIIGPRTSTQTYFGYQALKHLIKLPNLLKMSPSDKSILKQTTRQIQEIEKLKTQIQRLRNSNSVILQAGQDEEGDFEKDEEFDENFDSDWPVFQEDTQISALSESSSHNQTQSQTFLASEHVFCDYLCRLLQLREQKLKLLENLLYNTYRIINRDLQYVALITPTAIDTELSDTKFSGIWKMTPPTKYEVITLSKILEYFHIDTIALVTSKDNHGKNFMSDMTLMENKDSSTWEIGDIYFVYSEVNQHNSREQIKNSMTETIEKIKMHGYRLVVLNF